MPLASRAVRWDEFAAAAPELAALGEERLRGRELCLVGTLRANGWPRISPVEPEFVDGELMLGMMWRSPKALDLLRDPRLVVHSVVSRREGDEGDFKLYGRAVPVEQGERRDRYRADDQGADRLGARGAELPRLRGRHRLGRVRRVRARAATAWPGTRSAACAAGSSASHSEASDRWWRGFDAFLLGALPPRSRVLDVGCGDGALVERLAAHGLDAVGVDPNAPARPG